MRAPSRKSSELAFTLIELLTVIAVIVVLAGIAFPVTRKTLEGASATKDLSNLRQLGMAMNGYFTEETCFPGEAWPTCINPRFITDWKVFQSSFDRRKPAENPTAVPVSYDLNAHLYGMRMLQIASPANCIMLAPLMANPSKRQFISTAWQPGLPCPLSRESNGAGCTGGTHHNENRITVLYADLHAAEISMGEFHSSMPNPDTSELIEDLRWNR